MNKSPVPKAEPSDNLPVADLPEDQKPQAEHKGDGQTGKDGTQPDFTGTAFNHPDVAKYSHGGSATEAQKPVASPNPVASTGNTDPKLLP